MTHIRHMTKGILGLFIISALITGCGNTDDDPKFPTPDQIVTETDDTASTDASATAGDSTETAKPSDDATSSPADAITGKWVFAYNLYHSEYNNDGNPESYDYCTTLTDEFAPESFINIQKKDGKFYADYKFQEYEYSVKYFGNELILKNSPAYTDCENKDWHLEFSDPFGDMEPDNIPIITLLGDDRLIEVTESFGTEEYDADYSLNLNVYLRDNSPLLDDPEEIKYFDTVRVSTAVDLLNSIQNNRKVILESGTYNLSGVSKKSIDNPNITETYMPYVIDNVSNFCLEADEGADVLICIDDPYAAVLDFENGSNITFRGLTVGHNVEPGYCSGSVLYCNYINGLDIEDCHLYGSGTYGLEASYTYDINVKNTEIYECTYGLVDLNNIGYATFTDCVLRDSSDMSMINVNGSYSVTFENCEFKNNNSMAYESCSFAHIGDYDKLTFTDCSFSGNEYYTFANREVTLENCTADNNHAGFNDLMNKTSTGVPDKATLLKSYDEAVSKQTEIDNKLSSDSLLDQLSLNQLAYEEFDAWDSLLNNIWSYLKENLSEEEMTALTEEQKTWIKEKEASVKEAGSDFEGGSMQPMIENSEAATITRKRVEELINKYLK